MNKFSVARSTRSWMVLGIVVTIYSGYAYSQSGVLLNCELKGGYPNKQIYINEGEGYVFYNVQHRESYERQRVYKTESEKPTVLDVRMHITVNNDVLILANDQRRSFVFIKDTATFAYASTMLAVLEDGEFIAVGNHAEGKCSVSPFSQPDE